MRQQSQKLPERAPSLTQLQSLHADEGSCVQYLSALTQLTRVCLGCPDRELWEDAQLTAGLAALHNLPSLVTLKLHSRLGVQLSRLGSLTQLQQLSIEFYRETVPGALQALTALPRLSALGLPHYKGLAAVALPIQRLFLSLLWMAEPRSLPDLQGCSCLTDVRVRLAGSQICLHAERFPAWPRPVTVSIEKLGNSHVWPELGLPARVSVQLVHHVSLNKLLVSRPG